MDIVDRNNFVMINLMNSEFENPKNVGKIDSSKVSSSVLVGCIEIGAVIQLDLEVKNNTILDAKFKAYGAAAIACMSWLTEKIKGSTLEQAIRLESLTLSNELDVPSTKLYICFLAIDALQMAISKLKAPILIAVK